MQPEIWKEVPGLDFLVRASSWGRIKVGPYMMAPGRGQRMCEGDPTFGKQREHDGRFTIYIKKRPYLVARLVCKAFHGLPPVGQPNCLHIDENHTNNVPTNLKWGTQKENLNAPGFLAYCRARTSERSPTIKARAKRRAAAL